MSAETAAIYGATIGFTVITVVNDATGFARERAPETVGKIEQMIAGLLPSLSVEGASFDQVSGAASSAAMSLDGLEGALSSVEQVSTLLTDTSVPKPTVEVEEGETTSDSLTLTWNSQAAAQGTGTEEYMITVAESNAPVEDQMTIKMRLQVAGGASQPPIQRFHKGRESEVVTSFTTDPPPKSIPAIEAPKAEAETPKASKGLLFFVAFLDIAAMCLLIGCEAAPEWSAFNGEEFGMWRRCTDGQPGEMYKITKKWHNSTPSSCTDKPMWDNHEWNDNHADELHAAQISYLVFWAVASLSLVYATLTALCGIRVLGGSNVPPPKKTENPDPSFKPHHTSIVVEGLKSNTAYKVTVRRKGDVEWGATGAPGSAAKTSAKMMRPDWRIVGTIVLVVAIIVGFVLDTKEKQLLIAGTCIAAVVGLIADFYYTALDEAACAWYEALFQTCWLERNTDYGGFGEGLKLLRGDFCYSAYDNNTRLRLMDETHPKVREQRARKRKHVSYLVHTILWLIAVGIGLVIVWVVILPKFFTTDAEKKALDAFMALIAMAATGPISTTLPGRIVGIVFAFLSTPIDWSIECVCGLFAPAEVEEGGGDEDNKSKTQSKGAPAGSSFMARNCRFDPVLNTVDLHLLTWVCGILTILCAYQFFGFEMCDEIKQSLQCHSGCSTVPSKPLVDAHGPLNWQYPNTQETVCNAIDSNFDGHCQMELGRSFNLLVAAVVISFLGFVAYFSIAHKIDKLTGSISFLMKRWMARKAFLAMLLKIASAFLAFTAAVQLGADTMGLYGGPCYVEMCKRELNSGFFQNLEYGVEDSFIIIGAWEAKQTDFVLSVQGGRQFNGSQICEYEGVVAGMCVDGGSCAVSIPSMPLCVLNPYSRYQVEQCVLGKLNITNSIEAEEGGEEEEEDGDENKRNNNRRFGGGGGVNPGVGTALATAVVSTAVAVAIAKASAPAVEVEKKTSNSFVLVWASEKAELRAGGVEEYMITVQESDDDNNDVGGDASSTSMTVYYTLDLDSAQGQMPAESMDAKSTKRVTAAYFQTKSSDGEDDGSGQHTALALTNLKADTKYTVTVCRMGDDMQWGDKWRKVISTEETKIEVVSTDRSMTLLWQNDLDKGEKPQTAAALKRRSETYEITVMPVTIAPGSSAADETIKPMTILLTAEPSSGSLDSIKTDPQAMYQVFKRYAAMDTPKGGSGGSTAADRVSENDTIQRIELRALLKDFEMNEAVDSAAFERLFASLDKSGDGQIEWVEFFPWFMKAKEPSKEGPSTALVSQIASASSPLPSSPGSPILESDREEQTAASNSRNGSTACVHTVAANRVKSPGVFVQDGTDKSKVDDAYTIFQTFDTDNSDTIDAKEMSKLIAKLGCVLSSSQLATLFEELDTDNSGAVSWNEFYPWYVHDAEKLAAGEVEEEVYDEDATEEEIAVQKEIAIFNKEQLKQHTRDVAAAATERARQDQELQAMLADKLKETGHTRQPIPVAFVPGQKRSVSAKSSAVTFTGLTPTQKFVVR
jgi:Ca2+-binding EF-hand superfamily protein